MGKRIDYLDYSKGIAIILVVLGHIFIHFIYHYFLLYQVTYSIIVI